MDLNIAADILALLVSVTVILGASWTGYWRIKNRAREEIERDRKEKTLREKAEATVEQLEREAKHNAQVAFHKDQKIEEAERRLRWYEEQEVPRLRLRIESLGSVSDHIHKTEVSIQSLSSRVDELSSLTRDLWKRWGSQ